VSMLSLVMSAVVAFFGPSSPSTSAVGNVEVLATVACASRPVAALVGVGAAAALVSPQVLDWMGIQATSDQILGTTVQDPSFPNEPWEVTTYRREGESYAAFIRRHRETVNAVRAELGTI